MSRVTILIPIFNEPNILNGNQRKYRNILAALRKKCDLKIYWVVVQLEKVPQSETNDVRIINFHDYRNAFEILDEVKPDIILINGWMSSAQSAFSISGKNRKIPIVVNFWIYPSNVHEFPKLKVLKKRMRQLFATKISEGDTLFKKKSTKLTNLKFIIKEYLFFVKTIQKIKSSYLKKTNLILSLPLALLTKIIPPPKLINGDKITCFLLENKSILIKAGFNASNSIVIGNPDSDGDFLKIKKLRTDVISHSERKNILLCATSSHELGVWTKEKDQNLIIKIIKEIQRDKKYNIGLKIHPSNALRSEYEEILKENNLKIPLYQKEDFLEVLNKYDMMITYDDSSTTLYSALLKKPVLLLNVFPDDPIPLFFDEKITTLCQNFNELFSKINYSMSRKISEQDYEYYYEKYLGKFDGKCSERVANVIVSLIQ